VQTCLSPVVPSRRLGRGVEQLALSRAGDGQKLAVLSRKYPTGALATLEFSDRWGDLRPGHAELTDFVTPMQLFKR
jgi:phosphohistidine phosphatase